MTTEHDVLARVVADVDGRIDVAEVARVLREVGERTGDPRAMIASGILIERAWTSLRIETDDLLQRLEAPALPVQEEDALGALLASEWAAEVAHATDAGHCILDAPGDVLVPPVRRTVPLLPRRVTLDELAAALAPALEEAQERVEHVRAAEARRLAARERRDRARSSVVLEDPRADMQHVLGQLQALGRPASVRELAVDGSRSGWVAAFVAVLELARAQRLVVTQAEFPTTRVMVAAR